MAWTALGGLDPGPPTCQRMLVNTVDASIIGLPSQRVPYVCGKVASVESGNELICADCAQRDSDKADARCLQEWSNTVTAWAHTMRHRPQLTAWLRACAEAIAAAGRHLNEEE